MRGLLRDGAANLPTGDGKTYLLKVGTAGPPWSYIQRFPAEATVPQICELPIEDFTPVGMRLDPAPDAPQTLDPSIIGTVPVYILDKQQGPFKLARRLHAALCGRALTVGRLPRRSSRHSG